MAPSAEEKQRALAASHQAETQAAIGESWSSLGASGRATLVFRFATTLLGIALPQAVGRLLGLWSYAPVTRKVADNLHVLEYDMPLGSSNCAAVVGRDGKLLLHSPPPTADTRVVEAITKLGEPSVIVATMSHDTFADRWLALYPGAKVTGPARDREALSKRAPVSFALEDLPKDVKDNFGVEKVAVSDWAAFGDATVLYRLRDSNPELDGKTAAVLPCGYTSHRFSITSPASWGVAMAGFTASNGVRFIPLFSLLFARNLPSAEKEMHGIGAAPDLRAAVTLHGPPVLGADAGEVLRSVRPTKARNLFSS